MSTAFVKLATRFLSLRSGATTRAPIFWMAVGAVFIGTFLVILSTGILSGFHSVYRRAILDFNSHLIVSKEGRLEIDEQKFFSDFLSRVSTKLPLHFSPYLSMESLMPSPRGLRPVFIKGVDRSQLTVTYPMAIHFFEEKASLKQGVLVGEEIWNQQIAPKGDKTFRFLRLKDGAEKIKSRTESLPVLGTFRSGLSDFDSQFVLMDFRELQERYFDQKPVDGFDIRLADINELSVLVGLFEKMMGHRVVRHNPLQIEVLEADEIQRVEMLYADLGLKDLYSEFIASSGELEESRFYSILKWDELNGTLLEAHHKETLTFYVVSTFILLICLFNIIGFNFMFFLEREREFRILYLLGLSQASVSRLLMTVSLGLGAVAAGAGTFLALLILYWLKMGKGIALDASVYYVDRLPVEIPGMVAFTFLSGAIIFSALSGFLTSRFLLRQSPALGIQM